LARLWQSIPTIFAHLDNAIITASRPGELCASNEVRQEAEKVKDASLVLLGVMSAHRQLLSGNSSFQYLVSRLREKGVKPEAVPGCVMRQFPPES